ncbi:exodeoxyribonuclease VII small subunit [Synechococcales cyanobacterium C]|uniref:Exodeoxyribonuclease 7 small subunit n=1 Tax=Petrachloros mirabilis ULC683 TaxID=2781853 RepID=A0A8K2AC50_9CYAN|nr:exodeoxyribonuclease VII small subunit [Petrachloros mirabilis]NCJ05643.1 exodeoxyribonuclease VII small subunit [Petrachloros mirabilis ULC683]
MSSASASSPPEEPQELPSDWHYESTVTQIEAIIQDIEVGNLDLAQMFEQFTQAIEYLHQCDQFLEDRQAQMDILVETLTDDLP